MPLPVNAGHIAKQAGSVAGEIATEIEKVHGPIWSTREELCKLIISLACAVLAGTITFAEKIVSSPNASPWAGRLLVVSWVLLFISICLSLVSVWYAGTFRTLRARFVNSEPQLKELASQIQANTQRERAEREMALVRAWSDSALAAIAPADARTASFTRGALVAFCFGLTAFIVCGALRVT